MNYTFSSYILTYEGDFHLSGRKITVLDSSDVAEVQLSLTLCSTMSVDVISHGLERFAQSYSLLQQSYDFRVVIFTDSPAVISLCKKYNIEVVPSVESNSYHKPVFPSLMKHIERTWDSHYYGYVNGDILLSPRLFRVLSTLKRNENHKYLNRPYMLAGRVSEIQNRTFDVSSLEAYSNSFEKAYSQGHLRNHFSADYFIYSGKLMSKPTVMYEDVVLGRYFIDNWVMGMILLNDGVLIDATDAIHGIHLGIDTYWKKALWRLPSYNDYFYNKRIVKRNYPWNSLHSANFSVYWENTNLCLDGPLYFDC